MTDQVQLYEAVENVAKSFEAFKETNDKMLEEERKGNESRAKELAEQLEKISSNLTENQKKRDILQKKLDMQSDRLEMLEALQDRPKATIQERIHSEHKELFMKWIRSGGKDRDAEQKFDELAQRAKEVKDVTIGTNSAGGFAVPTEIAQEVDKILLKTSPILQYVKNVNVSTTTYHELISVNDTGSAWTSETGSRTKSNTPELRRRTPTWGELYAYPRVSQWSLEDPQFNVEQWLSEDIEEAFSVALSQAIYNGNGSSRPTGIVNTAPTTADDGNEASPQRDNSAFQYVPITTPSSPYTTSGITADTLIDLMYKLNSRLRPNARFAMNTTTQGHVRKLKDTYGQYLWQPSFQAGQPDMLLGYPVFTWEQLGDPTTANAYPIAFGDFRKGYTLATIAEMRMIRDEVTAPGHVNFYVFRRYGGIVTNNSAIKLAKVAVS